MTSATTAGYSGTPLAKKLGIQDESRVLLINPPVDYIALLSPLPPNVVFEKKAGVQVDLVQLFTTDKSELATQLEVLRGTLRKETPVWVSWPKKASKVPTSITEDVIRAVALPLGWVDIKVCAVDMVWSGLKLVVRKSRR